MVVLRGPVKLSLRRLRDQGMEPPQAVVEEKQRRGSRPRDEVEASVGVCKGRHALSSFQGWDIAALMASITAAAFKKLSAFDKRAKLIGADIWPIEAIGEGDDKELQVTAQHRAKPSTASR